MLKQPMHSNWAELLRDRDVATLIGVTVRTIISWRQAGKLPYLRIGRGIFYRRESIEKMLSSLEKGAFDS